jgi:hypothetical protein
MEALMLAAVVFSADFEDANITAARDVWGNGTIDTPAATLSELSSDVPSVSPGTQSVKFSPDSGNNTAYFYKQLGQDYSELYVRYYVKYQSSTQDYSHTGMYVGGYEATSANPQGDAGLKGVDPNGCTPTSTTIGDCNRLLIVHAIEQDSGGDQAFLNTYDNFIGMQGNAFEGNYFGRAYLNDYPLSTPTEWACIETRIKLDSTAGAGDGEMQVWADGVEIQNFVPGSPVGQYNAVSGAWEDNPGGSGFPGLNWTDTSILGLNWVKIQNNGPETNDDSVWFDDVVVAEERIGCLGGSLTGGSLTGGSIQ